MADGTRRKLDTDIDSGVSYGSAAIPHPAFDTAQTAFPPNREESPRTPPKRHLCFGSLHLWIFGPEFFRNISRPCLVIYNRKRKEKPNSVQPATPGREVIMKSFITILAAWLASCILIGNLLIVHLMTVSRWIV